MRWSFRKKHSRGEKAEGKTYSYEQVQKRFLRGKYEIESSMLGTKVDIVVPIFNDAVFLDQFFEDIKKTKVTYRLILIDDASPQEELRQFLKGYAQRNANVDLVCNAQQIGLTGCINRGLAMARNHVVVISPRVQLPPNWLERLIAPIIKDPTVASATPFTNDGSICSFPLVNKANTVFNQIPVEQIDGYFREIRSIYTTIPTGVAFCMAMNHRAIKEVGLLDQRAFGMGGCEDSDWCRRAVEKGFRNVMVENLYVYHDTTGGYASEERRQRIQSNREKLTVKHPDLADIVKQYWEEDPLGPVRAYVLCRLTASMSARRYLIFHNRLQGAADVYIQDYAGKRRREMAVTAILRYHEGDAPYQLEYQWGEYKVLFELETLESVWAFSDKMEMNRLIVNQLVTYPRIGEHLQSIREYAEEKGIRLMVMVHDYYLICPSMFLMNGQHRHCSIPAMSECQQCMESQPRYSLQEFHTVREWRSAWRSFLLACQEIRVFSQDSARLVKKAYGGLDQIQILPMEHTPLPKVDKAYKTTETLNIGLLGTLTELKGARLVQQMVQLAEERKLPIRFILCGNTAMKIRSRLFTQTEAYRPEQLPRLILEQDIDLFFMASIWPETFSYTTQEVMEMGMPVACLPLGAPAERVSRYEKGTVLSEPDAERNLHELLRWGESYRAPMKQSEKAVFLWEKASTDHRYLVEHLQEQLYAVGVASDGFSVDAVSPVQIRQYKWVVLYQCLASKKTNSLIQAANEAGASIWYSIDEFAFEQKMSENLETAKSAKFLKPAPESEKIRACMKACDGILVSTEALKREVESQFSGKKVLVHQDAASYEMLALSKRAMDQRRKRAAGTVVVGFWGESSTDTAAFAQLEPIMIELMGQYPNLRLRIGGTAQVSKELEKLGDRVKRWSSRPGPEQLEAYMKVDVQLMPFTKTVYDEGRSERKWLEAALVQVPTVAAYTEDLANVIHSGEDGILCCSQEDWKQALQSLTENPERICQMGKKAREAVWQSHVTAKPDPEIESIFQ